jgi:hypothetical protein
VLKQPFCKLATVLIGLAVLAAWCPAASGQSIRRLIAGLKSRDAMQQKRAVEALVALGPKAAPAIPGLIAILKTDNTLVRDATVAALGRIGPAGGCYDNFQGELYHLADDPLELQNWYNNPASAEVRSRMTTQLLMHVMCSLGRFPAGPARAEIEATGPETKPDNSVWK